jgi:uncharacterized protein involved in exopolysaccharide biosynthesis
MFQFDVSKVRPSDAAGAPRAEMSVLQLLGRLWRGKYWALAGAVLAVAAALLFSAVVKPSYEASALVYIDPQDLQLLQNDIASRPPSGDSGAMFVESQSRIMQSDQVMRDVVSKLGLATDPEFESKAKGDDPELALQGTIDNLSSAVRVVHADRTYVIEIYARSEDPHKAAAIANAVVDSYLSVRETQRTQQAASASDALEQRLAALRDDVTAKEDAVDKFKAANGLVTANGTSLIDSRLTDANGTVSAAQRAMDEAKTQLAQIDVAKTDPAQFLSSPAALASADLQRLRGEYDQAVAALQTETATLGPKHPNVVRAQGQVNSVSRSITTMANRLRTSAKLQYDTAVADYNAAVSSVKTLTTTAQSNDTAQVQLRQLERDSESSRAVYEDALLRSRQTRAQEQINTANVQVISQATAPIQKRFPPRLTVLVPLAIAIGLALGAGLSLMLQTWPVQLKRTPKPVKSKAPAPDKVAPMRGSLRRYAALPDREQGNHVH